MRDNTKVTYTGMDENGLAMGDQGRVLSTSGSVVSVMWSTGSLAHQVTPVYDFDLAALGSQQGVSDALEDSLDVGGLMTFSARRAFDVGGEVAVLNEMAEAGHLASFSQIAEEAITHVAARIRQDASFRAVASDLDEDEAESVLRLASACLIRDAFGEAD